MVRAVLIRRSAVVFLLLACGTRPALIDGGVAPEDAGSEVDVDAGDAVDAGSFDADAGFDAGTTVDAGITVDRDGDGLDDAFEERVARDYLPNLSLHPQDGCPLGVILYRVRKHPTDASLLMVLYDHLYETDCGIGGHTGDNEVFAVTVNPGKPAPAGITAMKAISHQNTACQKITTCGSCNGLAACDLDAASRPRVYASRGKHGTYVQKSVCTLISICPDDCAAGDQLGVPLANAGEPGAPLIRDLTDAGLITADAGWTKTELFNFDPWGPEKFGNAGRPSEDFGDPAFDTAACQ